MEFFQTFLQPAHAKAKEVALKFAAQCGRPCGQRFPFGNPVSIESTHLPLVRQCPYLIADKSDGVRACILFCKDETMVCAVVLDRLGNAYGLPVQADTALFQGTMLDAEIVKTKDGRFATLVFDACALAGASHVVEYAPLTARLDMIRTCVPHIHCDAAPFRVKHMFHIQTAAAAAVHTYVRDLDYAVDGFILTPDREPTSLGGTAPQIFKIKECHTMDFLWSGGMLWYGDEKDLFPVRNLQLVFYAEQLQHVRNGAIVEMAPQCSKDHNKDGGRVMLHFAQERPDKSTPNTYMTVSRTLQSIVDAVTLEAVLGPGA